MIICKANKDQRKWFWKDEVKPSTNNLASLICKFLEERNELEEVETNKLIETVNKLIQEYLQQ